MITTIIQHQTKEYSHEQDNDTLKAALYIHDPATIIYALLKQGSKATNTIDVQPGRSHRTQLQQLISI